MSVLTTNEDVKEAPNLEWAFTAGEDPLEYGTARDALLHGTGAVVWRNGDLGGDVSDILRKFARSCALDVQALWNPPSVVLDYLETDNEDARKKVKKHARQEIVIAKDNIAHAKAQASDSWGAGVGSMTASESASRAPLEFDCISKGAKVAMESSQKCAVKAARAAARAGQTAEMQLARTVSGEFSEGGATASPVGAYAEAEIKQNERLMEMLGKAFLLERVFVTGTCVD